MSSNDEVRRLLQETLARRLHAKHHILSQVEAIEPEWQTGWIHHELSKLLDGVITAVERKLSPRLIICLPPRAGKTVMAGRHFPAQILGRHPEWSVVYATYNEDRASDVGRKTRGLFQNPILQDIHPALIVDPRSNSSTTVGTEAGGDFFAVGRGGALTGRGMHIGIVDDILKDREEAESTTIQEAMWDWYTSVLRTRVMPGAGIIVMNTRWSVRDLTGRLLDVAKADPNADQWCVYSYPALAVVDEPHRPVGASFHEARFSTRELLRTKASIPPRDWESLYQQNPFVPEGNHFKASWFQFYRPEQLPKALTRYASTDFATTKNAGDHSCTLLFGVDEKDNIWWLPETFHEQCEVAEHDEATWRMAEEWDIEGIFVEKGTLWNAHKGEWRRQQIQRRLHHVATIEFLRTKKKLDLAQAMMVHMQNGKVFFPDLPWFRNVMVPQCLRFNGEDGGEDDVVDTICLPLLSFKKLRAPSPDIDLPPDPTIDPVTAHLWKEICKNPDAVHIIDPFSAGERDGDDDTSASETADPTEYIFPDGGEETP